MFFNKLLSFLENEALARNILSSYRHVDINVLTTMGRGPNISNRNKTRRFEKLTNATNTYWIRHYELIDGNFNHLVHDTYLKVETWIVLRCRVSNHKLKIDTGRQEVPFVPCSHCKVLKDEKHAILYCSLYTNIRSNHLEFLQRQWTRYLTRHMLVML